MTAAELICLVADGICAGSIKATAGHAEIEEYFTYWEAICIDAANQTPNAFTFTCDVEFERMLPPGVELSDSSVTAVDSQAAALK